MTQPSTQYTLQHTSKTLNNPKDNRFIQQKNQSKVRETVRKFDMIGNRNHSKSPPRTLPLPPQRPPVSTKRNKINNNQSNETPTSSISSLTESVTSENILNPNDIEQQKLRSNEKSTNNTTTQTDFITKSQVLTSKNNIQPISQQKFSTNRRRSPPPVPPPLPPRIPPKIRDYSKPQQNTVHNSICMNSENESDEEENKIENQPHKPFEIHKQNEEPELLKVRAKPVIVYKEVQVPSSTQNTENFRSKITTNGHRRKSEQLTRTTTNQYENSDNDSIGLEIAEPVLTTRRQVITNNGFNNDHRYSVERRPSTIADYGENYMQEQHGDIFLPSHRPPPPPPTFALPYLQGPHSQQQPNITQEESQPYISQRSLPLSNFLMQLGALLVVFILCMVLVLAIRADETNLRTTLQAVYTYIYLVSIIWMIWCTFDIIKFRRQWMILTSSAQDHDEYMDIAERHPHKMSYFPDIHSTSGLFMKVGAGLLCMGSLILNVIELAKIIATIGSGTSETATREGSSTQYSSSVVITRSITYILRFLFHCIQFTFLFRYGNLVIDRYHLVAKIGLLHLVIANFCTWFEAIVFETLEQLHKTPENHCQISSYRNTTAPTTFSSSDSTAFLFSDSTTISSSFSDTLTDDTMNTSALINFVRVVSSTTSSTESHTSALEIIYKIEEDISVYLYPCLIEYSLISLTIFFIMWRNVGRKDKRSFLRFGDRHIFTVNCSRASRGLLIGGIIFLLTILTLIPTYLLENDAVSVTHITELVLLTVALFTVCISYIHTTKLYYDRDAHVDVFDQVLILITTVGDFAYSFFGLFASLFIENCESKIPIGVEISIGFLAIFQTFLQSSFIMDTLKRRTRTKHDVRSKPGRETITALLLINLAIWLHDTLSAKKVKLNPLQVAYYDVGTWAIIQAFTSPLSIFYRFHSSVCLADIWQEVYEVNGNNDGTTKFAGKNAMNRLSIINSGYDNQ